MRTRGETHTGHRGSLNNWKIHRHCIVPQDKWCIPKSQMDNNILQDTCGTRWSNSRLGTGLPDMTSIPMHRSRYTDLLGTMKSSKTPMDNNTLWIGIFESFMITAEIRSQDYAAIIFLCEAFLPRRTRITRRLRVPRQRLVLASRTWIARSSIDILSRITSVNARRGAKYVLGR